MSVGQLQDLAGSKLEGSHNVDHRADIYSLGVVIYEMLTGELPIGRFAVPSKKVEIDVRLDDVVLRTLEKEPQRRYQRASQIKSDVQSITSTSAESNDPGLAETLVHDANDSSSDEQRSHRDQAHSATLEKQELAGRLLLIRRQLMDRVEQSLRPLVRGEVLQILIGVALIAIGAQCWARNTQVPHRLVSGIILHVYGVIVVAQGVLVCTRVKRIDFSKPVTDIRSKLDDVRSGYLLAGPVIGFAWWLMWIPLCVSIGFDAVVVYRHSLIPCLVIGVVGLFVSLWLYWRALKPGNASAESWKGKLSGESIAAAYLALEEIENAQIR